MVTTSTKRVAIIGGAALAVGGLTYLLTRKAKAAPPPPPTPGLANLYGVVIDSKTGKPIPSVLVTLNGLETYTDANGNYAFLDITPGTYVVTFSKEGYQTATY